MCINSHHLASVTLCMLFTVHKKLGVAHTEDFNHTNYTLKYRHNITLTQHQ